MYEELNNFTQNQVWTLEKPHPELNMYEVLKDPDWVNAMHEELNNFTRNQVWTLEKSPQDARVIGTKWVFRNKQDDQGVIVRNKERLVAKGFSQVEGLDFGETFAPVA
jgi:hypothetical protein